MHVTIVLPAYNEADNLPPLLERIACVVGDLNFPYRIVVVDDGSTDSTAEAVRQAGDHYPVTLVQHRRNMGLGAALTTGLRMAIRDDGAIITMDADNSHDPGMIPGMLSRLEYGDDFVVASRFCRGGCEIGVPGHRRVLSHVVSAAMRLIFPYPGVRDYSSGYRAYRTSILRRIEAALGPGFVCERGFACMFELLLKLRSLNAIASEVPLVLRYDRKLGPSKMQVFRTVKRYMVVMWTGIVSGSTGKKGHATLPSSGRLGRH